MFRRSVTEFLVFGLFLACSQAALARTRPHYGGTLRIETQADAWQRYASPARRLVFEGLTRVDSAGVVRPALAINWKSDDADHRWQFQLRTGIHFHDASPLTAGAVASALQEVCKEECPWAAIRTAGSQVIFTSNAGLPNLPALLAGEEYLIQHASANGGVDGTGPFEVSSFSSGVLTLKANADHWAGRPFVETVELRTRRSVRDQWADLEAGHADVVEVPAENMRLARQRHLNIVESRPVLLLALQVNASGPLADVNLRSAIGFAMDRGAISDVIFQKQGESTASLTPAWMTGYSFLFSTERDLNKAHQLRGGASPPPLTLAVDGSDPTMQLAAGRIALDLHEAGFRVEVVSKGSRPGIDLLLREVPLEQGTAGAVVDASQRIFGNHPAARVPLNTDAAGNELQAALNYEQETLADARVIPLVYLPRGYAMSSRVREVHLSLDGTIALADVSLEDSK